MKTAIITASLALASLGLIAQEKKATTVRIKKIEKINGIEKIKDTSYVLENGTSLTSISEDEILSDESIPSDAKKIVIIQNDSLSDTQHIDIENLLREELKEGNDKNEKKEVRVKVVHQDSDCAKGEKKIKTVTMIKMIRIESPNPSESKLLAKSTGIKDNSLSIENLAFFPNPSSGRINLKFELPNKGNTEVSILNSDGKIVYDEKLADFSGIYNKEIDLSLNAKGIYFIQIKQGDYAQLKKIILE